MTDFLYKLRWANKARQEIWDPDNIITGNFGALFRSNEMVGEAGEAANEVKKLVREAAGIRGSRTTIEKLGDELADVVICVDLVAEIYGIDLIEAIKRKFNQTSDNVNIQVKL